ncbi:MAG: hypothetical protein HPY66_3248 [Firmicutes bacterium]|nr:hypothetical protein [Bacillota bacterium]
MAATLYYVRPGDTLSGIARRFGVSAEAIAVQNIICNPNLIFIGEVLLIPDPGLALPRVGASPYYVVRPGDTLWCLANAFGTTVSILAANNNIADPNLILAGQEILILGERPDPQELNRIWQTLGGWPSCDEIPPISIYGIYYSGSFAWEALGAAAVPYLLGLLNHSCNIVRIYTVISFARLARNGRVRAALALLADDPDATVRQLVPLALRRIALGEEGRRNVHLAMSDITLLAGPDLGSASIILPIGTEVAVLRWHIPSPTGEEGPRGGIQIYDRVRVLGTGRVGFVPRVGFNEIPFV